MIARRGRHRATPTRRRITWQDSRQAPAPRVILNRRRDLHSIPIALGSLAIVFVILGVEILTSPPVYVCVGGSC